jgi:hypothetical protein
MLQENELVALLTATQKDQIYGQLFAPDSYFNPIQDADANWVISTQEQEFCVNLEFLWVKNLPLIPYHSVPQANPGNSFGATGA